MNLRLSAGLVLEGGGMRGVFTSGVLDAFMNIWPAISILACTIW